MVFQFGDGAVGKIKPLLEAASLLQQPMKHQKDRRFSAGALRINPEDLVMDKKKEDNLAMLARVAWVL